MNKEERKYHLNTVLSALFIDYSLEDVMETINEIKGIEYTNFIDDEAHLISEDVNQLEDDRNSFYG